MLTAFRVLAKAASACAARALDVFGRTAERRTERALIGEYENVIAEVLDKLTPHNHALAVELASIPEHIRGYGHVKERHLKDAKDAKRSCSSSSAMPDRRRCRRCRSRLLCRGAARKSSSRFRKASGPSSVVEGLGMTTVDRAGKSRRDGKWRNAVTSRFPQIGLPMATNPFDLSGRVALVTGAARGLGHAIATALAEAGAVVVLNGRDKAALGHARAPLDKRGLPTDVGVFDVTDGDAVKDGVAAIEKKHGAVDIVVNNAGIQRRNAVVDVRARPIGTRSSRPTSRRRSSWRRRSSPA